MSYGTSNPSGAVGDALARRAEARWGPACRRAEALRELGAVDRAVYEAVARTPTAELDGPFRRLSGAADRSRLWLGIAAAVALLGGSRGRRAALEGVASIGVTSAAVNLGMKSLYGRWRPARREPALFEARHVPMPTSASFPSGHAASAFAFAYAVGRHLPGLPCRSECWRPGSPTPGSTAACTTRATWWPAPSWRGDRGDGRRGVRPPAPVAPPPAVTAARAGEHAAPARRREAMLAAA
jgi:PAP2 superfamily